MCEQRFASRGYPVVMSHESIQLYIHNVRRRYLLRLVGMQHMRVAVRLQALRAPLTANARLLVPTEERLRRRLLPRVNENGAGLQTLADALGALDVLAPHAGTQTGVGVVRSPNDLLLI